MHRGSYVRTPEILAKQSAAQKGKINHFKGKKHSPESRAKIKAARKINGSGWPKGRKRGPQSPELIAKRNAAVKYRPGPGKKAITYKDGLWLHPLAVTHNGIMTRCYKLKSTNYPGYGAKSIKVWEPWHARSTCLFALEALLGPRPLGYSLDRINPHGDYLEWNVRWANPGMQTSNTRETIADYYSQCGEH
jgi:hypothetical protein